MQPAVSTDVMREVNAIAETIAKAGGTPLAVAKDGHCLGVVHLKDIVKGGIRERFAELRRMGIRTIMITGDNPTTAAAIAAEAGVDDFSLRRPRRTSFASSRKSRRMVSSSPCAATAPTMRLR